MTDPRPITAPADWTVALDRLPELPERHYRQVVVLAAHPDDETLGASGFLQSLHAAGARVRLVVATDGEGAFPDAPAEERAELGRLRRTELAASLRAQGLTGVRPHWLGLPDSGLAEHAEELRERLTELLAGADLCLLPWPRDPHPDHRLVGRIGLEVAPPGAYRLSYPIWMWPWQRPQDEEIPWSRAYRRPMPEQARRAKAAGIAAFASQLRPGPRGEPPILPETVLAHFDRDTEVLFREQPSRSAPIDRFAELYRAEDDPWGTATRWYERRKRELALAALPAERYGVAVEPACGTGELTRLLAGRCDEVLAFDPVPAALLRARAVTAGLDNVRLGPGALPGDFPDGPVDLVVFSEILYYLDDADLTGSIERAVAALRPGGHLLGVHWRPWAPEAPRDGAQAHRRLREHPALDTVLECADERFLVHVGSRR